MDRIETRSREQSTSINDNLETWETLYEMVKTWIDQPWDGTRLQRIAEELWDSINAHGLIDSPYGASVTLLESCIVESVEGIESGQLDVEQAVDNLRKLLENEDFVEGATVIKVYVKTNPVCRISNIDDLISKDQSIDYRKPQWWTRSVRSYWLLIGGVPFGAMFIIYAGMINLGLWLPMDLVLYIIITPPLFASSYYIRTVATKRMWRMVYIMLGAGGIGFWCLAIPMALLFGPIIRLIPLWLRFPLTIIAPAVTGAYMGDWFGKRRDYMPYM